MLRPIQLIWDRIERARQDSDTALFMDLLYAGEMAVRLTVAGMVAAVRDDTEHNQYRLIHRLVRADGIGDWSQALDDAITGPASQQLARSAQEDRSDLTERHGRGAWQFEAVSLLHQALKSVAPDVQPLPQRVALRNWYAEFPVLRNKTRGHGAPTQALCSIVSPPLEASLRILVENMLLFKRQWAYLHRNLSGKYKVLSLGGKIEAFDKLKTRESISRNLPDGVYVSFDDFERVDLISTTVDLNDFFFPNGGFAGTTFELHSPITDSRREGDGRPYLSPAGERPPSETGGKQALDVVGNVWANLPAPPSEYVKRPILEFELVEELRNDRHAIVTLVGRGGIGKTSLALTVLHAIASESTFDFIFWFSARDIDLLPIGPKTVRPHVLTEKDIANEFVQLVGPGDGEKPLSMLASCMATTKVGKSLFVFDNFETVRSPVDLFGWIDTNIRLPNKVLITSRLREFRADFPIQVGGMERSEADKLIEQTARKLGISDKLTESYRDSVFEESDGHPYVIKIVLGEVADTRNLGRPERIIARKDEILDALFERTFSNLSPAGRRVFLTLCAWRSLVPQLALEAVLFRPDNDPMDVSRAVDELVRVSLVERAPASDGSDFLAVPLVSAIFGAKKLTASPLRVSIEADVRMLQGVGATTEAKLRDGLAPRVRSFFAHVAERIADGKASISEMRPVLELLSRNHAPGWLLLAEIDEEHGGVDGLPHAAESLRRFLETNPSRTEAQLTWERLAEVYARSGDVPAAADAHVRAIEFAQVPFSSISNTANWLNNHRTELSEVDRFERADLFERVIKVMQARLEEANATDLSRLAWLHLPRGTDQARTLAMVGLAQDPTNSHCLKLVERLSHS